MKQARRTRAITNRFPSLMAFKETAIASLLLLRDTWVKWVSHLEVCELCGKRKGTHIEHFIEAGIRVCDQCR